MRRPGLAEDARDSSAREVARRADGSDYLTALLARHKTATRWSSILPVVLRAREGDIAAVEEVISASALLIAKQIRAKYSKMLRAGRADDLVSAGVAGIQAAIRTWRPKDGAWSNCAFGWICSLMRRAARSSSLVAIPENLRNGPSPMRDVRTTGLNEEFGYDAETGRRAHVKTPVEAASDRELSGLAIARLSALSPTARKVLILRYGVGETAAEIGRERGRKSRSVAEVALLIGKSRVDVRKIESQALRLLRDRASRAGIEA